MLLFFLIIGNFVLKYSYYRPHFGFFYGTHSWGPEIGDLNKNGYADLVIQMVDTVEYDQEGEYILEFIPDSGFVIRDSFMSWHLYEGNVWVHGIGDFDNDGNSDIIIEKDSFDTSIGEWWEFLIIFESPDSFSYPLFPVWRDTGIAKPYGVYDVDKDNLPEIFAVRDWDFPILKSTGNNTYSIVAYDTTNKGKPRAFGYLDGDSLIDGFSTVNQGYCIREYTYGEYNNTVFCEQYVLGPNIGDFFITEDMDRDGLWEIFVKSIIVPWNLWRVFIIEAISDNVYTIKKLFEFNVPYMGDGGHSAGGDVDGDGIPEALIEMTNQIKIIKAFSDDSFYVWETINIPANNEDDMWILIYDLDNNGINDIIVVTNNKIFVYEWSTGVEEISFDSGNFPLKRNIIKSFSEIKNKDFLIFDITGRKISSLPIFKEERFSRKGVYFIKLKNSEKRIKVIKIK